MAAYRRTALDRLHKSVAAERSWRDPVKRRNRVKAVERSWRRREVRRNHSLAQVRAWKDPQHRVSWLTGREKAFKRPEVRKRLSLVAKRRWKRREPGWTDPSKTAFGPSGTQRFLRRRLQKAGIRGLRLEYRAGRYSIDIGHPPTMTAIECDGYPFTHRSSKSRRHDKKRDRFLRELGYTVIRVRLRRQKDVESYDISHLVRLLTRRK